MQIIYEKASSFFLRNTFLFNRGDCIVVRIKVRNYYCIILLLHPLDCDKLDYLLMDSYNVGLLN